MQFHVKLSPDGRIVIPAQCRKALKISAGDELIISVANDEAILYCMDHAIKKAQNKVAKYSKGKDSLSGMLIDARRKEAKDE